MNEKIFLNFFVWTLDNFNKLTAAEVNSAAALFLAFSATNKIGGPILIIRPPYFLGYSLLMLLAPVI